MSQRPNRVLQSVRSDINVGFGGYGEHSITLNTNTVSFRSINQGSGPGVDQYFLDQTLRIWGNGSLIHSQSNRTTARDNTLTFVFTSSLPSAYTTLRFEAYTIIYFYYYFGPGDEEYLEVANIATDITYNISNVSVNGKNILTLNPTSDRIYFLNVSNTNALFIKNISSTYPAVIYMAAGVAIDQSQTSTTLLTRGGCTLLYSGSSWFIGTYYAGTLGATAAGGGTQINSNGIAAVNITGVSQTVILPSTSPPRPLIICAYTTNTSTSNRLFIHGNGNVDGQTIAIQPNSGPCCGLLLISNGSAWYIVGIFQGGSTSFDSNRSGASGLQSTFILSTSTNTDSIALPTMTTDNNASIHFFKTTNNVSYNNGAVLFARSGANCVNANFGRFYRNGNTPYSGYLAISFKASGATSAIFPIAMYPSEF